MPGQHASHGAALLGGLRAPRSPSAPAKLTPYNGISTATSRRLLADYQSSRHAKARRSANEYVNMGQAYLTSGFAEPAIRCFSSALLDAGPRVDALYGRGNAYELMEATEAAIADYTAAIQLEPLTPQLYKSRANALLGMERFDEAMEAYKEAMAVCSLDDDPDAMEAYGRCLFELAEHERAEEVLSNVLRHDQGRAVSLMYRGCARMELRGEHDPEALADFESAHALDPSLPTQMRQRAQRELRSGNAEQAAQTLSRCALLDRNNPLVLFDRARCWLRCFPPDVPRALADMGECADRLRAAQADWRDNDGLIGCLRGRADLLLERNRPAEALPAFDELVGMYPPAELPRGVVLGRLKATHALQAKRVFEEEADPDEWTADEVARATVDSDTLCDVHTAALGDPAAVEFLLKELSGTPNGHYIRANLLARNTWAKPIGSRREEAMREALGEFWKAHRCGFNVRSCGAGRPGVVVTTAWSLGAAEPEIREEPRPVPSLAKLCTLALAAAGPSVSGVDANSPGFAHAALCALLAREALPRALAERRPSAELGAVMIAHVLAQRRVDTTAFDWARWAGTLLSASAIVAAHANGGFLPPELLVAKAGSVPTAKGATKAASAKASAGGQKGGDLHSLATLCVCAVGRTLPTDLAEPFELTVPESKVAREWDEAMVSFRILWQQLRQPTEEELKKAAKSSSAKPAGAAKKK